MRLTHSNTQIENPHICTEEANLTDQSSSQAQSFLWKQKSEKPRKCWKITKKHQTSLVHFRIQELSIHSMQFTLLMFSSDGKKSYSDITHSITEMYLSGW